MVKGVVKLISVGSKRCQEIENPTPHKFFFCHYYTILRRNSQQAFRRYKICGAVVKEKEFSKKQVESAYEKTQNRCLVPKENVLLKNCGLLTKEQIRYNK